MYYDGKTASSKTILEPSAYLRMVLAVSDYDVVWNFCSEKMAWHWTVVFVRIRSLVLYLGKQQKALPDISRYFLRIENRFLDNDNYKRICKNLYSTYGIQRNLQKPECICFVFDYDSGD